MNSENVNRYCQSNTGLVPNKNGAFCSFSDYQALEKQNQDLREELAEVEAFTKHVGAPSFAEARDVTLRTIEGFDKQTEEQFHTIKRLGKELAAAREALQRLTYLYESEQDFGDEPVSSFRPEWLKKEFDKMEVPPQAASEQEGA